MAKGHGVFSSKDTQVPLSYPNHLGFRTCKVYYGRGHIVPIAPIYHHIHQVTPFFVNQLRVCGVFQHIVLIPDGSRYYWVSQPLYKGLCNSVIRYANTYSFLLFEIFWQLIASLENKSIWPREGTL